MSKRLLGRLGGLLLVLASTGAWAASGLTIEQPWVNEAPPGAAAMAGYMVVNNAGATARVLVGASSPAFGSAMLHRTVMKNGMAEMVHQKAIRVPAHGHVTFAPGGYHIMLMKPKHHYVAGDAVKVMLRFRNGEQRTVRFPVKKGAPPMGGMNMHHGM